MMKEGVKWPAMPYEEYRLRTDKAKQIMTEHGLDAMLLFSPVNWRYYGGWTDVAQMHCNAWRSVLILTPDRDPAAVVHAAFGFWNIPLTTYIEDVRVWSETPGWPVADSSFWSLFYDTLSDLKLNERVLGVETGDNIKTYLSIDEYRTMVEALPKARIVSADAAIWEQRMVKTPFEIEVIREGCHKACKVVRRAFEAIRPGVNELEVHRVFWEACAEQGLLESPNESTWLCWSSNAEEAGGVHRWITPAVDRIIQEGDAGICDTGPTYKGYQIDIQRTFYVGTPPPKQIELSELIKDAFLETLESIKPGIQISDIHAKSVETLQRRDPEQFPIIDFMGHSMGLANHEPPWIRANEKTVVQPGMVFCIEMGAFDPQQEVCGSMPEDIVLVTEDGIDNLTSALPLDLWIAT
jgi:Xaa-Pro aminopeptidase